MMSAQETTAGHAFSRASLTWSTTSNDLREFMLERASFSPTMVGVSSSNMEASHPWTNNHHAPPKITNQTNTHKMTIHRRRKNTRTYIHKTVMELEAHNRGNTSGFHRKGPFHHISDYHFCVWTCFWVKPRSEIRWCHHLHKEHHNNHAHHHHSHPHAHLCLKDSKDGPFLIFNFLFTLYTRHGHRHWSNDAYIWFVSAQLLLTHFFQR